MFGGLAVCIFLWGLQYKLSLYDPPQAASHQVPIAKLLSKDEHAAASVNVPLTSWFPSHVQMMQTILEGGFLLSLFLFKGLSAPGLFWLRREISVPWDVRHRASLSAFHFRPPPDLW
jgi:hypothetical protein